jgi:hypothetical protein
VVCLTELIHKSQSAFINGRFIQDSFWFIQSAAKLLHVRQKACLLLKIDMAKAFDSVACPFLIDELEFMGFPVIWCEWISTILSISTTRITINVVPRDVIHHGRGLRQGNPLSPMLFLLIMEVLSALICWVDNWLLLQSLELLAIRHRATLYADDLILAEIHSERKDPLALREIFSLLEGASGLVCNLAKCQLIPIR